MPTASAPAARASSAFAPGGANTATRTALPVPAGRTVEPRTCWSDFLASTPRRTATSTDSTNLVLLLFLRIFRASSRAYCLPGSTSVERALNRLLIFATTLALHHDAHAAGATGNGAHRGFQIGRR